MGSSTDKQEKQLEGFDVIYKRIPHISIYQVWLFAAASYTVVLSGQVQNGSVVLNAKPENYRCFNSLDQLNGSSYGNVAFASPHNPCKQYNVDWVGNCPNAQTISDFEECSKNLNLTDVAECSVCDKSYFYSPSNTFTQTAITQFNWVCDDSIVPVSSISTSIFMLGLLFGALGFGNLSDRIGRKKGLMVAMVCGFVTNLVLVWIHDPYLFTFFRFLSGLFAHACVVVSYVYIMEVLGPKARTYLGCQHLQFFELGIALLSVIGYYNRDWHNMQLYMALFSIPFFVLYFFIPTSPRWLYAKGRNQEARKVLMEISDRSGGTLDEKFLDMFEEKVLENEYKGGNYSSLDLFKYTHMRLITFIMFWGWLVTSMVYYGLGLNAGSLSGDIFANNAFCALFDALAKAGAPFIIQTRLGRRLSLSLMFFIGGFSCLGAMLLNSYANCDVKPFDDCIKGALDEGPIPVCNMTMAGIARYLAFIGKFASSGLFTIIYIYTVELYPTCVRASAVGLCSAGGRIGGALSPLVFGLDQTLPWFSNTFFGVCSIIAGGSTLFLPETINKPMAQTMEEAENNYYKNSTSYSNFGDEIRISEQIIC